MSFEFWGFTGGAFFGAPAGWFGYVLIAVYSALSLLILWARRATFRHLSARQWLVCLGLLLAGFLLAQLFILRIPANILPPPGLPVQPRAPGLALFALLPAVLAGGWLGVGPAFLVGLLTGVSRAAWETYAWTTPFEYAFVAAVASWSVRQNYRGLPARLLRHPLAAGLAGGVVHVILLLPSYWAYSQATGLAALDYVWSQASAAAPVYLGQAVLAGLLAELVRLGVPAWWPAPRALVPPPYVASLNRKLLFTLFPLSIVGLLVLVWANITAATVVSRDLVFDQMASAAEDASRGIPFFIQTGQNLISNFAAQEDLLAGDEAARAERLGESLRSVPFFRQLTVLGPDLLPIAGYPAGPNTLPPLTNDELPVVKLAQAGIPHNTPLYPNQPGQPVDVLFAMPIAGEPGSVLLGYANLGNNPLMQAVTNSLIGLAGGAGQGFIVDEQGVVIFHPDAQRLLQPFAPEPSARRLSTRLAGASAYQDKAPDGTRRLVLYYPVPGHPWSLVVMVPNEVVLSLATNIARPTIGILFLLGIIGLTLVSLIASRVTQPAEQLALAAQRISDGRLDEPVIVNGEDEIGRAGLAFERMRQRLRARLEELSMLLRVSQGVASSLNLDDALPPILEGALTATGAAGARLVLVPADDALVPDSAQDTWVFCAGPAAELMAPLDSGVLQVTREEGRAVLHNLARARAVLDASPVAGRLHALMALPLRLESNYYGAFWLAYDQPHTFTEAEISFLTTLAGQAAVSVANARLFAAAEQGRQRLAAILASTPDAVVVTDRNARVLLVNPAAESAFGLTGKPVIGRPVAQVLEEPELVRLLLDGNASSASNGKAGPGASEFQVGSGRTLYASASSIISADGSVLGRLCVLRDVTHFKELDQMKSEFVSTVSHDLRAPLTFMRGYATMLPMVGALNDKQREFVDKITGGVEQMTVLIEDLLDLGRIEAGVGVAREPVPVNDVINAVVQMLSPHAANRGLQLAVDVQPNLPPLLGDSTLLRQALSNLVDNAIKYTSAGGQVTLRVAVDDQNFQFSVTDTGVGIAPADQAHLFEKFFRVRQRGSTQVKGSGLGLAIVKSIVERHGGRVWVESKLGQGSTFYLSVPCGPTDGQPPQRAA